MACSGPALLATAGGGAGAAATPPVAQIGEVAAGSWLGDPQPASVMANATENPRRRIRSAPLWFGMRARMFLPRLLPFGVTTARTVIAVCAAFRLYRPWREKYPGLPTSMWPRHPRAPSTQYLKLHQKPRWTLALHGCGLLTPFSGTLEPSIPCNLAQAARPCAPWQQSAVFPDEREGWRSP